MSVQRFHRSEEHINHSVGAWKKTLQDQGCYLPESGTLSEDTRESYFRQLSSALKNHFSWWASYQNEGVHEDRHMQFKFLQATFNIPKRYENPDHWLPHQQQDANHCRDYRCVSVWWYYDQAIQENIAEAAATQRQLALQHHAPDPHEDMDELDSWDIYYDDLMLPEHRSQVMDLLREIKRIKQRQPSKVYTEKRTSIINNAEAARQLDRNSPQIPFFLHRDHLATDKRMTPTINTKFMDMNNLSRNCATPTHGCAKWKFPPLSMDLLVKAPFKQITFNPSPSDHSINTTFTFSSK